MLNTYNRKLFSVSNSLLSFSFVFKHFMKCMSFRYLHRLIFNRSPATDEVKYIHKKTIKLKLT